MKKKFLVTGATGFVGSNIVKALVKDGQHVSVISRNRKLNWRLSDIALKIDIYEVDILSPNLVDVVRKIKPDYIFHLAAYGVLPKEEDPFKMVDVNIKGTMNLISSVKKNPFKLFVNTGTSVEYGVKENRMSELDILEPINEYGITKAAATLYCQKEGIRNKLPIINLRLFTPFGYYEDETRLIPSVILSVLKNEPIRISVPASVRDFIFIEDIVDAYLKVVRTTFMPGDILNIGSGRNLSIEEVVDKILEITKSISLVEWGAVKPQKRFIEPKRWEADTSKVEKVLKWKPDHTIDEGLKKTFEWFKKNQKLYANASK